MSPAKTLLDAHVHVAALDDGSNGCHISPKLLNSAIGFMLKRVLGLDLSRPPAEVNRAFVNKLLKQLRSSKYVARGVVLAFDAIHRPDGSRDLEASSIVVSNDYVLKLCSEHPELLPAASVHPLRRDALDELSRVSEAGAVLVKLLPVSQIFDPRDPALEPYWRKCAELKLPLLIHTGLEFTLSGHAQQFGDPAALEAPLAVGATVIAAHACSRGLPLGEKHLGTFKRLVAAYPQFYADSSALTIFGRFPMLLKLRHELELLERLTFATDYPVPPSAIALFGRTAPAAWWRALREKNPFDKPVRVFRSLGLEPSSAVLERLLPESAGQQP